MSNKLENCDVYKGEAVQALAYLLSDSAKREYKAYNVKDMKIDAHDFH